MIAENIQRVQDEIAQACARADRDPAEVTLVAVSKRKPIAMIYEAWEAGVRHFGENRLEEAQEKIPIVNARIQPNWHMIGHIQSRKAKHVPPLFDMVESVDRLKIANKLSDTSAEQDGILNVLLEVNISGEAQKHGLQAANWQHDAHIRATLWQQTREIIALPHLTVQGLMTMAPFLDNMEETRPVFAGLRALRDALAADLGVPLPDLSMGMTNDYPVAIEEGATIVRVGRAIFGERD